MVQKYLPEKLKRIRLDEKDKKILSLLNKDARINLATVSNKTGIPVDTVKYRLKRMKEEGIFSYAVIIDPVKMGYPIFNTLLLQLVNFTQDKEDKLIKEISLNPNIAYGSKISGKYDFAISFIAKDFLEFNELVQKFKTKFQEIIKDIDMINVLEEYKYDYLIDLL